MAGLVKEFASGVYNLVLGMFTTGKHLGRHAITIQYPKEKWTMPERSRGMVVLLTDHETGKLNCTACLLCMKSCPSGAINIEVIKDEKKKRHLKEFRLDFNLCCFCGLCEEVCNFAAIKLAPKYEFPEFDKSRLSWDKDKLAEMGLDVPYEKPERRKPVAKTPAQKTASEGDKKEATSEKTTSADKTSADTADSQPPTADTPVEAKPETDKDTTKAEDKAPADEKKDDAGQEEDKGQ